MKDLFYSFVLVSHAALKLVRMGCHRTPGHSACSAPAGDPTDLQRVAAAIQCVSCLGLFFTTEDMEMHGNTRNPPALVESLTQTGTDLKGLLDASHSLTGGGL